MCIGILFFFFEKKNQVARSPSIRKSYSASISGLHVDDDDFYAEDRIVECFIPNQKRNFTDHDGLQQYSYDIESAKFGRIQKRSGQTQ